VVPRVLWKESLNSDGQQFHHYQQNEQQHLIFNNSRKTYNCTAHTHYIIDLYHSMQNPMDMVMDCNWVSEWLLFNANSAIFQLYCGGDVVVHFVDSGGIVDHRCLNFLFIILLVPHIITTIETSFHLRVLCLKTLLYISWDIIHVSSSVIEWYIYE
jgi:hypothetical protein